MKMTNFRLIGSVKINEYSEMKYASIDISRFFGMLVDMDVLIAQTEGKWYYASTGKRVDSKSIDDAENSHKILSLYPRESHEGG